MTQRLGPTPTWGDPGRLLGGEDICVETGRMTRVGHVRLNMGVVGWERLFPAGGAVAGRFSSQTA